MAESKNKLFYLTLRAFSFLSIWRKDKSHMTKDEYLKAKVATILAFFTAGIATAPWASVVPYVKSRLDLDAIHYASIILCFGLGAIIGMPMTGKVVAKVGMKKVLLFSIVLLYLSMTLLCLENINIAIAYISVLLWGFSLGILDVANNIHAALLEKLSGKHLMSRFHAYFTLGCIFAALFFTILLYLSFHTLFVALLLTVIGVILLIKFYPNLINTKGEYQDAETNISNKTNNKFKITLILVLLGITALIMYLTEGMVYDWSGVYLIEKGNVAIEIATIGYLSFEISVTIMRFVGDKLIEKIGELKLLTFGGIIAAIALFIIANTTNPYIMIIGFFIVGLCLANVVPVMFSNAAKESMAHQGRAISFVGTMGYSGLLLGPGILGSVATYTSLSGMIEFVALLVVIMVLLSFYILKRHN